MIKNIVENLIRTEDANLPYLIRSLQADNALWILVEALLDGTPLYFSRANAAIAKLELIGILKDRTVIAQYATIFTRKRCIDIRSSQFASPLKTFEL
jgi:hypothetical protein